MENNMRIIVLILFVLLFTCDQNNKIDREVVKRSGQNIYEDKCKYPIKVIYPYGKIDKIKPDGDVKKIYFDSDKGFKYYAISDSIKVNIDFNSKGKFYYILSYNTLHNPIKYLAYIYNNNYGLWLGMDESTSNIDAFNETISSIVINIQNSQQAVNHALYYLRISNNGSLERLYLRNVNDIWILAQYYENSDEDSYLHNIDQLSGNFGYSDLTIKSKYIDWEPDHFSDYSKLYGNYNDLIKSPEAKLEGDNYKVIFYVWGHFNGNLERWELALGNDGKLHSLQIVKLKEGIGLYRHSRFIF